jgi:hypothetical protein
MNYVAYVLDERSVNILKEVFPPKYPDFIGHHITYRLGTSIVPKQPKLVEVVGYVDDKEGLEALIVEVDGTIERRDGGVYHITWSLDRSLGMKPSNSNLIIAHFGYVPTERIQINTLIETL